jgi:hypothetical protein
LPLAHVFGQQRPLRIGQVIIVGNDQTPDWVIRRELPFYPGQVLDVKQLRVAEENLLRSGRFLVEPECGIRPTVALIEEEGSEYRDVLVSVQELPYDAVFWRYCGVVGGVALALVATVVIVILIWRYSKRPGPSLRNDCTHPSAGLR